MKYLISLLGLCLSLSIMADDHNNHTQKEYFDNGKPKFEVTYKNGKKNGKEIFWYENGNKMMESFFVNDHEEGSLAAVVSKWAKEKLRVNYSEG